MSIISDMSPSIVKTLAKERMISWKHTPHHPGLRTKCSFQMKEFPDFASEKRSQQSPQVKLIHTGHRNKK